MMKQFLSIKNLLTLLGVSISLSVGAILLTWLLSRLVEDGPTYFFSLIAVAFSVWYGNKRAGVLTALLTTMGISVIFFHSSNLFSFKEWSSVIELPLYFLTGLFITFIIDRIQNTSDIKLYKARE